MNLYTLKSQQNQWNIVWNFEKMGKSCCYGVWTIKLQYCVQ